MNQTAIEVDNESLASRADEALEQLLYSAHAFAAVAVPVSISMILASLAVVFINDGLNGQSSGGTGIPVVFEETGDETGDERFVNALVNALAIVGAIIVATFLMVFLYYFKFMKTLMGWLIGSTALLLAFSTGLVVQTGMILGQVPFDAISYSLIFYNFAIVGVTAVFYQKGIPTVITGGYLICISVTMAWILLRYLPEWTSWALLGLLAFYDLCAVLTPCGPLKWLVGIMQERDEPLPGLLYEARVRGGAQVTATTPAPMSNSTTAHTSVLLRGGGGPSGGSVAGYMDVDVEAMGRAESTASSPLKLPKPTNVSASTLAVRPPTQTSSDEDRMASSSASALHERAASSSLVAAQEMRVATSGGAATSPVVVMSTVDRVASSARPAAMSERPASSAAPSVDRIPSFAISQPPAQQQQQQQPRPQQSPQQQQQQQAAYADYLDETDQDKSIKLGLGDFVFYSLLCARAALVSFTTFIAVFIVVLFGLALTLVLLAVYRTALPALPISILLGLVFFFAVDAVVVPFVTGFAIQMAYS